MSMIRLTPKDFDYDAGFVETAKVYDIGEEIDSIYGMQCAIIDDEDIEALKSGKILRYEINCEYTLAIRWVDN